LRHDEYPVLIFLLWVATGVWVLLAAQLVVNLLLTHRLDGVEPMSDEERPLVSIVVPARNEEAGIEAAVRSFCRQDYGKFEVIAVDDRSEDGTAAILNRLSREYKCLRVVSGREPPRGWLGKPHALEIGRNEARGEWLLFVDADVVYAADLLSRAMAAVERGQRDMLTLVPNFGFGGVFEAALMSHLYFVGYAMLPVALVNHSKLKWIAAGGGICNLVSRRALKDSGAFDCLRDAVVDDMGLGYKVKAAGYRIAVWRASNRLVRLRMYPGVRATIEGFTKNLFPAIRHRPYLAACPFLFGSIVILVPYVGLVMGLVRGAVPAPVWWSLGLMHAVGLTIAWDFRQPLSTALLAPVRELGWWWIMLRSMLRYWRKGIHWRGRTFIP